MPMSPRLLRPRAAASAGFNPRTIADLGGWFDAADASTVTLVSGAVSSWAGKSGNGEVATQSTASVRPIYEKIEGYDGLRFPAVNTAASMTHNIGAALRWTVIAAVRIGVQGTPAYTSLFASGTSSPAQGLMLLTRANTNKWGTFTSGAVQANSTLADNTKYILTLNDNSTSGGSFFLNGNADGTFGGDGLTQEPNHIGSSFGQAFQGHVHELLVWKRVLTVTERQTVERYLGGKWGITVA